MPNQTTTTPQALIATMDELAKTADYSLLDNLNPDPDATDDGEDHRPRQVFSGHYVPVKPTPIGHPTYVAHSHTLFKELGLEDSLAQTEGFQALFTGDVSQVPAPMRPIGWATGYALSIYGTEYIHQCPFQTGNGYGDGRAVSVLEVVTQGQRWEMQLKGGGPTPYCRGADGRAVLRSSVREFLAQEHMHALGIPTSRSLCLFASRSEYVHRPWYSEDSDSMDPDIIVADPVAISTRVAPSFLRVGQLELFGRRARSQAHPEALKELEKIVLHVIDREYQGEIEAEQPLTEKVVQLASLFRDRLSSLVANWLRVGFCQGNFNSDNCALGGFTLDFGPFGFCERFDPFFQPWTGGGRHFSFLNQGNAAKANFEMFCIAVQPLLTNAPEAQAQLQAVKDDFDEVMQTKLNRMWAAKLGLEKHNAELLTQLLQLMANTSVDYNLFFRELSHMPEDISALEKSFYQAPKEGLKAQWNQWLQQWRSAIAQQANADEVAQQMQQINPKFTWREWLVVPAYEQAKNGNYALVHELQSVLTSPYAEQSPEIENRYYQLRPLDFFETGGVSHYSCSS